MGPSGFDASLYKPHQNKGDYVANIRKEHNKDNPYVILNKKTLEIPTLSWEAKGLWSFLLSKPDHWRVSVVHLTKYFPGGKTRIYRILKELIDHDLCIRIQPDAGGYGKGFGKTEYVVLESQELKKSLPLSGFKDARFPDAQKQTLTNTECKTSNESNNNKEEAAAAKIKYLESGESVPLQSLEEVLSEKLKPDEFNRAMRFLDNMPHKKREAIDNMVGFLIEAIKGNWDQQTSYKIPGESNEKYAAKVCKLIKLHNSSLKATNTHTYLEFSDGMWNKTLAYDLSPASFRSQIKSLLCQRDILKEIGNDLNLGDGI